MHQVLERGSLSHCLKQSRDSSMGEFSLKAEVVTGKGGLSATALNMRTHMCFKINTAEGTNPTSLCWEFKVID